MTLKWERNDRLRRKLLKITPNTRDELKVAVRRGANAILKSALNLVPRGETGNLAGSGEAGLLEGSPREIEGFVQFTAPHAHLIEFGTADRFTKGARSVRAGVPRGRVTASPFLFPAFLINRKGVRARISRAINKGVREVAGR